MLSTDVLAFAAERHGDKTAIQIGQDHVTYVELSIAVNALAAALKQNDPIAGSRVGLCAQYSLEYMVALMAITAADKVLVPLNCHANPDDLFDILNDTHPTAIFVDDLGNERIHADSDLKIHFSQFPGLVYTYRDGPDAE